MRLSLRQRCDLELLLNGAFSPLRGFMGRADYESVCDSMRLSDGTLWPVPVTLSVPEATVTGLRPGDSSLVLRDSDDALLAVLRVRDCWKPDREAEARAVFGTTDTSHPGVSALLNCADWYVGGELEGLQLPPHFDFVDLRLTPAGLRREFSARGWHRVVAFQTRNPIHRAHQELTLRAACDADAHLLIHPVVGETMPGDIDPYTRVRCYKALLPEYPQDLAMLSLLPLAMRMAGPREALWHAIIRKNYGCSHFIVGRDHASPGRGADGQPYWGPYDAQQLVGQHQDELGLQMVPFREMVYLPGEDRYVAEDEVPPGVRTVTLSGTEVRARLRDGRDIPSWFSAPAVVEELRRSAAPTGGVVVFFTGLSGAGKSTIARALEAKLLEEGRRVTLLDGDIVRQHLSSELGFSKEHRDLNIRRIGYVAAEVARHGGIAICAPIAPYDATRKAVRRMVEEAGGRFILVHVSTPIEVSEARDTKGLYAKARAGVLQGFTGVNDPYEVPEDAEITTDGSGGPANAAEGILSSTTLSDLRICSGSERNLK